MVSVSAVLTTTDREHSRGLHLAANSLDDKVDELVVVAHDEELLGAVRPSDFKTPVAHVPTDGIVPLAKARNIGARTASSDAVAFVDDDALAMPGWGEAIRDALVGGANAAGGPAIPAWESGRPGYLPRNWDWLVGAGPYKEDGTEVRNTYGCNIVFNANVFRELGGFDERFGKGAKFGQGEEAELAGRMREAGYGGVEYREGAAVLHHVPDEKTSPRSLIRRAYEQGVAKSAIGVGDEEKDFVRRAVSLGSPAKMLASTGLTAAVAVGYAAGLAKNRQA